MTLQEYDAEVSKMGEMVRSLYKMNDHKNGYEVYEELSNFQNKHMKEFLAAYKETIGDDKAKQVCYDLLEDAITYSESGSAIKYVDTKELADKVDEIIMDEIGDYLLDPPEIYQEGNEWAIDCMFGGNYVPYWDGWTD